jgi:hypothetical protein
MDLAEILLTIVRDVVLVTGLVVPGALLLRALRVRFFLAGAFLGSWLALYACVLAFVFLQVPITLTTMAAGLVAISCVTTLVAGGISAPLEIERAETPGFFVWRLGPWALPYALFGAVMLWRIATQPLNGGDIDFRWSWLAEQMVRWGNLDFYPPVNAADFARYFWVESIPPGVATLHAWGYLSGGNLLETWTAPGVLLQVLALHDLLWQLGFRWAGETAARRTLMVACAAPLLNWAVLIGQETGLTALAALGMILGLARWREDGQRRWLVVAAGAATLGASAREYGLVFPALGVFVLIVMRAPPRALGLFSALAVLPSLAWPVHVWLRTGNPFYSLNVRGLFPTNELFVIWAGKISEGSAHLFATRDGWFQLGRYLLLGAPLAALGIFFLAANLVRRDPRARWCGAVTLALIFLWYQSLAYTGGGLFYSMRLLSPVFALGALWVGRVMVPVTKGGRLADGLIVVAVLATLPLTLTFPQNAYHLPISEWTDAGRKFVVERRLADAEVLDVLRNRPGHERILTECVSLPRALAPAGMTAIPFWSPEVSWLFDRQLSPGEVAAKWRASGFRFVVMTRSPAQLELLARKAVWLSPHFSIRRVWQSDGYVILEVTAPMLAHQ